MSAATLRKGSVRAILTTALAADDGADPPGLILVCEDDSVESLTPAAKFWLSEILDSTADSGELPLIVASVAHRARQAFAERTQDVAQACVPRRAGGWLFLDASMMRDD